MSFPTGKESRLLIEVKKMNTALCQEDPYSRSLARRIDSTNAHTVKVIQDLEERGLIYKDRKGRKKVVRLTSEGEKAANLLEKLDNTIQEATA